MNNSVRWSLVVSKDTDIAVRTFLAQRGMRKGDLSKFVEEAVRWLVLDRVVAETKAKNTRVPPNKLVAAIDKAVHSVHSVRTEFKDIRASVRRKFSDQEIVGEIKRARRPASAEVDKLFAAGRMLARQAVLKKASMLRRSRRVGHGTVS